MESKANYTIVGFVVLILSTALLSTALWLSVGFQQKTYVNYTVYLNEAATGLSEEAPVKFNGVKVGYVKKIKLNMFDPRKVQILLAIEKGTPVTTSTTATLISQGITGVSYVGLSASTADLTPLKAMAGEPYPVIPARPSLFNQLDTAIKQVSENIDKFSQQARQIFSEENAKYLKETLHNMDQITAVISKNSDNINDSILRLDEFLKNLSKISDEFPSLTKEFKAGVADFRKAGASVSTTMIAGKEAIDKMSQETLPPAIQLLKRLNAISANLEQVSNDMRQNPSVIIRGTPPRKPGPGE